MDVLIALDQGTTSSRCLGFDACGNVVALAQREFAQHFPRDGWVEHEPEDIWRSTLESFDAVVREALVASVQWRPPPVSRHSRKVSTVPKASSPASARARAPATLSRIHASLVAEK